MKISHKPSTKSSCDAARRPEAAALSKTSTLPALEEIRGLQSEIESAVRMSLKKAIRIGKLLTDLKQECGHGKWCAFVVKNLPFSERAAQNYMGYYKNRAQLKSANVAELPISQAMLLVGKRAVKSAKGVSASLSAMPDALPGQGHEGTVPLKVSIASPDSPVVTDDADGQVSVSRTSDSDKPDCGGGVAQTDEPESAESAKQVLRSAIVEIDADVEVVVDRGSEEKPLFAFSDETPVYAGQWRDGVIDSIDVRNDFRARVDRNANALQQLRFSESCLLQTEQLIVQIGKILNELMVKTPTREDVLSFEEATAFLRNRLTLAASTPAILASTESSLPDEQ